MNQPNYHAWQVNPSDFARLTNPEQQAHFLLRYAVLAPSSHNTQPWRFCVGEHGQAIEIHPDVSRALPCSDPHHRQLYLSIGCALGNLLVAATAFDFAPVISYGVEATTGETFARMFLHPRKDGSPSMPQPYAALLPFIPQRRMNRAPYEPRRLDRERLNLLASVNDDDAVTVSLIQRDDHRALFEQFLELVKQSTLATQSNPGIIEEWARWFRPTDTQAPDGVPPFDFAIPEVASVAEQAKATSALFATAPVFLVLGASDDDPEHWIRVGKVLALLSLTAEKDGISQAPWGAVVEDERSAQRAAQVLGIAHPIYFSRLGYAKTTPHHSPRRPVEEVLSAPSYRPETGDIAKQFSFGKCVAAL